VCKSNEILPEMTASNSLPLYDKRAVGFFLIYLISYFTWNVMASDPPGRDVKHTIETVVIDAGHGGRDPGAVGRKAREKDIALAIALKVGKLIEENVEDVKVIYTRKEDVFVELYERADIANKARADLFISIHVNASDESSPLGTSSHVLGLHRTGEHFDVAVRENSVILLEEDYETTYQGFDPTSLESYIIFSVMQNIYLKQSIEFASYVQDQFRDRAMRLDRGVVQQGLLVLARTAMPGVLIETGFISNPEEEKFLMTDYGQDLIASGIYRAFKQYKARIEENSKFTVEKTVPPLPVTREVAPANVQMKSNPDDIYFLVQIASSRNLVPAEPSAFGGYTDVTVIEQGKWYKYAVGRVMSYHEALDKCTAVKEDFPGAFVIAVRNNQIVPLNEAILEINQ
jgi:N-acetylmuramoyl-L-alanine amidase